MSFEKEKFIVWCKDRHDVFCNQKYDTNMLYSKHLEFVVAHCKRFDYLLGGWIENSPYDIKCVAELGCWGHDLIEDARVTYNDLRERIGEAVADIIYCCTEVRGKDRDERHAEEYYLFLAGNRTAVFVKLCDIMANVTFSILTNSLMFDKHKKENEKTHRYLYRSDLKPMFDYLDKLFALWN